MELTPVKKMIRLHRRNNHSTLNFLFSLNMTSSPLCTRFHKYLFTLPRAHTWECSTHTSFLSDNWKRSNLTSCKKKIVIIMMHSHLWAIIFIFIKKSFFCYNKNEILWHCWEMLSSIIFVKFNFFILKICNFSPSDL